MATPYLTVTIRLLIQTALKLVIRLLSRAIMTLETRLLSRTALPNRIPKATIRQRSIPLELVQHSNISENSGVALSRAVNRASAAWETNMEILGPLQANCRVKKVFCCPLPPSSPPTPFCPLQFPITIYNHLKFANLTLFCVEQWVLGAGTETITILDTRFLRYCHEPSYLDSCDDYYVRISPSPHLPVSPFPR